MDKEVGVGDMLLLINSALVLPEVLNEFVIGLNDFESVDSSGSVDF